MIDTTDFPDVEAAVVTSAKPLLTGALLSNETPPEIIGEVVTVGHSGGGWRDWGEAAVNVGVNFYAPTDKACRALVKRTLNVFAALSNDLIEHIRVPAGATVVPAQAPPFQRYCVVTVYLRGQELDLS